MFYLQDKVNALRVCVLAVLLYVPLTSQALPYDDNHAALDNPLTAGVPTERDECQPSANPNRWADSVGEQCLRDCRWVFRDCKTECRGNRWCVIACTVAHGFCIYSCNGATRG